VSLFGWNYYQSRYQGATATAMDFDCQRRGWNSGATTATINTTASPGHLAIVQTEDGTTTLLDQLVASSTTTQTTTRASRVENIPAQETVLRLQIRCQNGSTAPASTTTWTLGLVAVENYVTQSVSIQNVRPQSLNMPLPVTVGNTVPASQSGTWNIATVTTVTAANLAIPGIIADVASAALTTTTTTATLTPTFGTAYQVNIPVTAVTGTNPTLDMSIEESTNSGTDWIKVYDFPRITSTGQYNSPILRMTGNRVRYVQTVGGTTPSFTRSVNRLQISHAASQIVQLINRTIVPNTLNSTSTSLFVEGCLDFNIMVRCTAQTTPATITLQFSHNATDWHTSGTTVATIVGIAHAKVQNEMWKFARLIVTAAGTGITLGEAMIVGNGQ
jgi:hypothetical protein